MKSFHDIFHPRRFVCRSLRTLLFPPPTLSLSIFIYIFELSRAVFFRAAGRQTMAVLKKFAEKSPDIFIRGCSQVSYLLFRRYFIDSVTYYRIVCAFTLFAEKEGAAVIMENSYL